MRTRFLSLLSLGMALFAISLFSGEATHWGLLRATAAEQPTEKGKRKDESVKSTPAAESPAQKSIKPVQEPIKEKAQEEKPVAKFETLTLRGQVRYLGEALQQRYGIETVPESAERQLVLDIPGGELVPLVEDIRGRAFRADERLRGIDVELLVRRYKKSPFVQVIRLYEVKKTGLFVLDYWCDVCAIAMYELKPCDCCQAPNRLRKRKVTPQGIADEEK